MHVRKSLSAALAAIALLITTAAGASAAGVSTESEPLAGPMTGPTVVPSVLKVGDRVPESDGSFVLDAGGSTPFADAAGASLLADGIVSPMATRTWSFTADFKASLQSSKFDNSNNGSIWVDGVKVTNCTPGYPAITIQLIRVNTLGLITWHGANVSFPCGGNNSYNWGVVSDAGYELYFARTGPVGLDENTKHVTGTVHYA